MRVKDLWAHSGSRIAARCVTCPLSSDTLHQKTCVFRSVSVRRQHETIFLEATKSNPTNRAKPNPTQPNPTQPNPTPHNTTQHNTTQHNTTPPNPIQPNTTQHNTTQHNPTQPNPTQPNTTQHNTTQLSRFLGTEGDLSPLLKGGKGCSTPLSPQRRSVSPPSFYKAAPQSEKRSRAKEEPRSIPTPIITALQSRISGGRVTQEIGGETSSQLRNRVN